MNPYYCKPSLTVFCMSMWQIWRENYAHGSLGKEARNAWILENEAELVSFLLSIIIFFFIYVSFFLSRVLSFFLFISFNFIHRFLIFKCFLKTIVSMPIYMIYRPWVTRRKETGKGTHLFTSSREKMIHSILVEYFK